MSGAVRIVGDPTGLFDTLPVQLHQAGFSREDRAEAPRLLINLTPTASLAIAAATAFADAPASEGEERLVVTVWPKAAPADWEACRYVAEMAAFTRHAALLWAPRQIRVNALAIDGGRDAECGRSGLAAMVMALWRWRSMTGQIIDLSG